MRTLILRDASASDAEAIADLHAESWRDAYRGMLSDAFLDGDVVENRRRLWRGRLTAPAVEAQLALVAREDDDLLGFAFVLFDHDPRWGAILDNLHVAPGRRSRGIGAALMTESARRVTTRRPDASLYLFVFERNERARRFYERLGGEAVERLSEIAADGSRVEVVRYFWRDLGALAARASAEDSLQ